VINKIGKNDIKIFLINDSEINRIVVSEKIIKKSPKENVIIFNLEYFEFSFDKVIKKSDTSANTSI
jgi:hypothetical protein